MAIAFARAQYLSRRRAGNVVRQAAYNARTQLKDERTGLHTKNFRDQGTLEHDERILPHGADPRFLDASTLWSAAELAERRRDGRVGLELVLAISADQEISKADRIDMVRSFVRLHFVDKGLAAQINIHSRHDGNARETNNPHAHVLISMRRLEGDRFSRIQARDLEPVVRRGYVIEHEAWGRTWGEFQDDWFVKHGKFVRVDKPAPIPQIHIGPKRHRHPKDPRVQQNLIRRDKNRMLGHDHSHNGKELVPPHKDTDTMESSSSVYPGSSTGREQQERALEGLSDKELVRALEMAARGPSAFVDLDQVRKELREESREGGDRGSRPETRGAFHERYQTERANAYQARKEAEQEVHDRFAAYQAQARGFFDLRYEQEKLGARKGVERHNANEIIKAQRRGDRVAVQKHKSQQLAAARSAHPTLTWESFVRREAQLGNEVAQDVLARLQEREQSNSLER